MHQPRWAPGTDLLDPKAGFSKIQYPDPIFAVGEFIKYDNKFYRITDFNYKCYNCLEIKKDWISPTKQTFLIASANAHAKSMGTSLEILRMLYL